MGGGWGAWRRAPGGARAPRHPAVRTHARMHPNTPFHTHTHHHPTPPMQDAAQEPMTRLNLREAQENLARRLAQLSPASREGGDPAVAAAVSEGEALLEDVAALGY